jgi:hypothetical protein
MKSKAKQQENSNIPTSYRTKTKNRAFSGRTGTVSRMIHDKDNKKKKAKLDEKSVFKKG